MLGTVDEIVFDCADPVALSTFWHAVLGGSEPTHRRAGWSYFDTPAGLRVAFQGVPEPKRVKNRVHLDVAVDDVPAAADAAVLLGATRQGLIHADAVGTFQVLLDPEGNEWCVVKAA
ncbi:VOC family protein [Herbiconiux sp. 11R-BC]|uniref:VOC family protein n=1 Tax=Herbiconiux sp. 11R-BC TaxID=3111637 RepID=UPI003C0B9585